MAKERDKKPNNNTIGIVFEKNPISHDELMYVLDSLEDLRTGNYYSSKPEDTIDDFLKELKS